VLDTEMKVTAAAMATVIIEPENLSRMMVSLLHCRCFALHVFLQRDSSHKF